VIIPQSVRRQAGPSAQGLIIEIEACRENSYKNKPVRQPGFHHIGEHLKIVFDH
jgi:hypothetical protein